ncbi:hypothetical protein, partial [Nocardiopsis composta]|uniref:hypothetical protein n=1 Tax=Nocardiopsis composta TaxID=157465 RepID=UPI0031D95DA6
MTTFGAEPIVIESLRDGGPSGPEPDRVPSKTERSEHCLRTVSLFQRFSGRPESSEGDLSRFFLEALLKERPREKRGNLGETKRKAPPLAEEQSARNLAGSLYQMSGCFLRTQQRVF